MLIRILAASVTPFPCFALFFLFFNPRWISPLDFPISWLLQRQKFLLKAIEKLCKLAEGIETMLWKNILLWRSSFSSGISNKKLNILIWIRIWIQIEILITFVFLQQIATSILLAVVITCRTHTPYSSPGKGNSILFQLPAFLITNRTAQWFVFSKKVVCIKSLSCFN